MEYVSVLAGERFTDRPRTVHPVLASVARVVNDLVCAEARQALLPLVPDLIGTVEAGRVADPVVAAIVATAVTRRSGEAGPAQEVLRAAKRRASRGFDGGAANRWWWRLTARSYRARAVDAVGHLLADGVAPAGDDALVAVFEAALAECRRRADSPTFRALRPGAGAQRRQQA